jgi:16S rRNA (cytosine1402-N4)-methyltransferase
MFRWECTTFIFMESTMAYKRESTMAYESEHIPVLLNEVIEYLKPQDGHAYVDATFGGGGYSRAILEHVADSRVLAIDRDPAAFARAEAFVNRYGARFSFFLTNFARIAEVLAEHDYSGIVFDFGVSSFQLEDGERGFSFQNDGPLDMRMDGADGASQIIGQAPRITASELVNTYAESDLASIIKVYGDEPFARKISNAIVRRRRERPINTTFELAEVVRSVVRHAGAIDPATKTFQALRIFINDELREIQTALDSIVKDVAARQLQQISVITVAFHSLEDRIVKNWWTSSRQREPFYAQTPREYSYMSKQKELSYMSMPRESSSASKHQESLSASKHQESLYAQNSQANTTVTITPMHHHVITPSADELRANPRSRSARMRAFSLNFNHR